MRIVHVQCFRHKIASIAEITQNAQITRPPFVGQQDLIGAPVETE